MHRLSEDDYRERGKELTAARERIAELEAALKPFADAADDELVKSASINCDLRIMTLDRKTQEVEYPVIIYEPGWVDGDDSKFLEVRHLRNAAEALRVKP
jgi:hypothetical protein